MMRSLSSAVAGLRTHQTKMDVIGNNVANVNTYGFKASRTTFADVYYQNLSGGSGPSGGTGGTNPTQIGYGSAVATIDVLNTQAGATTTDNPLDVYITADGFIVSKNANGDLFYTRLGALRFDKEGNLCDGQGKIIQGFPLDANDEPIISPDGSIQKDQLTNITIDPDLLDQLTGIQITNGGMIVGILPGNQKINLSSSAPGWITPDSATIPEDSNVIGGVRLKVRGQFTNTDFATAVNGTGITGTFGFGDIVFSDDLCLEDGLTVSAGPDGTISVKGYYVNEQGKRTQMVATANVPLNPDGTVKTPAPDTLEFKHNGKVVFTATGVTMSNNLEFPPVVAANDPYAGKSASLASVATGGTAVAIDLSNSGLQGTITATVTNNGAANIDDLKIRFDGTNVYASGSIGGVAFTDLSVACAANGTFAITSAGTPPVSLSLTIAGATFPPVVNANDPYATAGDKALATSYYYQGTWKDKGDNTLYTEDPATGQPGWVPLSTGSGLFTFGDVAISYDGGANPSAFNGIIARAETESGERMNIGCIVLARFRNAAGLEEAGNSDFIESANSGEALFGKPDSAGFGALISSRLEMSNVDIAKEFTDMITTQRGFQSNTRIVTVSDEMLQELVNLKR